MIALIVELAMSIYPWKTTSFLFKDAIRAAILPKMKAVKIDPIMMTILDINIWTGVIGALSFPTIKRVAW